MASITSSKAQPSEGHDLDTTSASEINLGVSLRQEGSGGSTATGTQANPLRTLPSSESTGTATISQPVVGTSSTTVIAANTDRKGLIIQSQSGNEPCYVCFAAVASTSLYTVLMQPTDVLILEPGDYSGIVTGITASGSATLRVTEID